MRPRTPRRTLALFAVAASLAVAPSARAFCRTTTSPTPADYEPAVSGCWTEGLPVYWANACVSFDVQENGSKQISYDVAVREITAAFASWTSTVCSGAEGAGSPSIAVSDLGPVECDLVEYDQTGPNQHVFLFRDDDWPYDDSSNTLALTTLSYDNTTGEIFDADVEINTHDQTLSTSALLPPGGYDFLSIVTHETGHFLGLAHATELGSTMYTHYTPGTTTMRALTADDESGLCSIYAPDGTRHVALAASPTGTLPEEACDPTPRHGFTTLCASQFPPAPPSSGCSLAAAPAMVTEGAPAGEGALGAALALSAVLGGRRRRRSSVRAV